jgi:hypothetical protein
MISTKKMLFAVMATDIVVMGLALLIGTTPLYNFSEAGLVTYFSFLQLTFIAWISLRIFIAREGAASAKPWKTRSFIWLIMAAAFVYLAMDETCSIHSGIDMLIHYLFRIRETGLTDRIDDIVVAGYVLSGLIVLYYYRGELKEYKKTSPLFMAGFAVTFFMIGLDLLTNKNDLLSRVIPDPGRLNQVWTGLEIFEDMVKVVAEGIFVVAFWACLKVARERTEG